MFEFHCQIAHRGTDSTTNRFRKRWIDDCFTRETVSADECTMYIDQYDAATSPLNPYISDKVVIVVEGVLHDLTPKFDQQADVSVSTATACEIVAAAYQQFDWKFPQYLIGDYRFLLFDRSQQRLIAGRDKTTYDPIYVVSDEQTTLVSTDLTALAAEIGASVNKAYLGEYLTGTIESQHQTFYAEINRVPPGCVVMSSDESTAVKRYYHPALTKRTAYRRMTRAELGDILRQKLETAITCRISATERTGVFMSGGADSTAIASLVTHHKPSLPLKTYSYTYPNTSAINEVDGINATVTDHSLLNERISLDDYWVLKDKALYQQAWATAPAVDPLLQPKDELLQRAAADQRGIVLVGDRGNMFDGHRLSIADALDFARLSRSSA
jgi:asparagine synthetase B (glutamine-hydrolysing)